MTRTHRARWTTGLVNASHEGIRPALFVLLPDCLDPARPPTAVELDPADPDEWDGLDCETCGAPVRVTAPPLALLDHLDPR